MFRSMFFAILIQRALLAVVMAVLLTACDSSNAVNQATVDSNDKGGSEYQTSPAEMEMLRERVVGSLCTEKSIYKNESESIDDCSSRLLEKLRSCEENGDIQVPETFSHGTEEFMKYAEEAVSCIDSKRDPDRA